MRRALLDDSLTYEFVFVKAGFDKIPVVDDVLQGSC